MVDDEAWSILGAAESIAEFGSLALVPVNFPNIWFCNILRIRSVAISFDLCLTSKSPLPGSPFACGFTGYLDPDRWEAGTGNRGPMVSACLQSIQPVFRSPGLEMRNALVTLLKPGDRPMRG
ncbi:hypothetical protein A8B75_01735 [Sphingomonadales bacterium EhC05]|nr:hypothetical protein A8B75_01735 [Sphingomonadales bacterium EhC05]